MAPSIKTLSSAFPQLSGGELARIRGAIRMAENHNGHLPEDNHRAAIHALLACDSVLGTFGIERISEGRNSRSPAIWYCNIGDPYDTTILYVNGRFRVGCWGDLVERGNYE